MSGSQTTFVGAEWFDEMDDVYADGLTWGDHELASVFVDWILSGFPNEIPVAGGPARSSRPGGYLIRASTLIELADRRLLSPLPMHDELAAKVRDYVGSTHDQAEDPIYSYAEAIFELKAEVARRRELDTSEMPEREV